MRLGRFVTKAGRVSPYFFNAGQFQSGQVLATLSRFYVETVEAAQIDYDLIFGPAYKGIPLAVAYALAVADRRDLAYAFNRKEAKDHGEGGVIVGAALQGRVLIIDDVISAGTSVRESLALIAAAQATPAALVVALDRMERGQGPRSAINEVRSDYGLPVVAIATLDDLVATLIARGGADEALLAIADYRAQYGET